MKTFTLLFLAALMLVSSAFGSVLCSTALTYSDLITDNGVGGCTIGNLLFTTFAFTPTSGGNGVAQTASQVGVSVLNGDGFQFNPGMAVNSGGTGDSFVDDLLSYRVSVLSGPPINTVTVGFSFSINVPGLALVSERVTCVTPGPPNCVNGGNAFQGNTQQLVVPPQTVLDVTKDIGVHSNQLGSAAISKVTNEYITNAPVPEPTTIVLIGSGLLLGLDLLRRRKRSSTNAVE